MIEVNSFFIITNYLFSSVVVASSAVTIVVSDVVDENVEYFSLFTYNVKLEMLFSPLSKRTTLNLILLFPGSVEFPFGIIVKMLLLINA